jgi:hypothetical protein
MPIFALLGFLAPYALSIGAGTPLSTVVASLTVAQWLTLIGDSANVAENDPAVKAWTTHIGTQVDDDIKHAFVALLTALKAHSAKHKAELKPSQYPNGLWNPNNHGML